MSSLNTGLVKIPENNQKYFGDDDTIFDYHDESGLKTFVAPALNTEGIILYSASTFSAGASDTSVMVGTSAPSTSYDGVLICGSRGHASGSFNSQSLGAMPLFVPAGLGLYAYSTSSGRNMSVSYEVL